MTKFENLKTVDGLWGYLVDSGYFTEAELQLISDINGYNVETLNDCILTEQTRNAISRGEKVSAFDFFVAEVVAQINEYNSILISKNKKSKVKYPLYVVQNWTETSTIPQDNIILLITHDDLEQIQGYYTYQKYCDDCPLQTTLAMFGIIA